MFIYIGYWTLNIYYYYYYVPVYGKYESCRCCMFLSCVHPVAVLNAACCMICSLLMLVNDGDHMEEAYSRAGLMTAL